MRFVQDIFLKWFVGRSKLLNEMQVMCQILEENNEDRGKKSVI